MKRQRKALVASFAAVSLILAACGGDDDTADAPAEEPAAAEEPAEAPAEEPAAEPADEPAEEPAEMALPGEGVSVTMAKADWSTEDPNAYTVKMILEEMGYTVSDPKDTELGPANAFLAMAQGDADFWINSWMPGHQSWLDNELPDGSLVGDHVTVVGEMMMAGGLQGYLITKSFADEYGITSLDDLNNNPDAIAAYDAQDPVPGNGIADIYGCQESYTCDDIIQAQIAFSGWENIQQTIAGYDAMFAEAAVKADAGEPAIIYTWTPSSYITQMRPGDNALWLTVDEVIDDSNPLGAEGGESYDQRPGVASIDTDKCPGSDGGVCQMGWIAADIRAAANNEFLAANPAVEKLLELFQMDVVEVSIMNVEMSDGADVEDLAAQWIEDNRDLVDSWIAEAMAAA
jgi:glycine betaine/proline transport system substrate-binding protein